MLTFIYSFAIFLSVFQDDTPKNISVPKGYTLIWNDEFDGKVLNTKKWNYRGLGKRDEAYLSKQSVKVDGKGHLIIEVNQRHDSTFSGMIATDNSFKIKYGYFECRARFANTPGTISSFWLQSPQINSPYGTPETDGAEIDIFEYLPHANKSYVSHAMHWGGYGANHHVEGPVWGKLENTPDDFHIIGFEWTENSYTTYVDGNKTFSGNQLISKIPEFLILSLLVTKSGAGPLAINHLPDQFIVDYVRVYKKN